ncbi:MAG: hypothetical protein A2341_28510 [Deltaproteobacteria bacterium RIFOXYB12_FULL_58_9]|nr:MAG: hypothetical protein A2341_28510 [Deltaproteobacteria bacterium RIFOXYB12_FULL_58_9]
MLIGSRGRDHHDELAVAVGGFGGVLVVAFAHVRRRKRSNIIMVSTSKPGNQTASTPDKGTASPGPEVSA